MREYITVYGHNEAFVSLSSKRMNGIQFVCLKCGNITVPGMCTAGGLAAGRISCK